MIILDWIKQYYEIRFDYKLKLQNSRVCESCETLKTQLSIANDEKRILLQKLMIKDIDVTAKQPIEVDIPILAKPAYIPWRVKQQQLEQQDRERAMAERNASKPDSSNNQTKETVILPNTTVEELEKELGIVEEVS